jgi:hypothetical protein
MEHSEYNETTKKLKRKRKIVIPITGRGGL